MIQKQRRAEHHYLTLAANVRTGVNPVGEAAATTLTIILVESRVEETVVVRSFAFSLAQIHGRL